MKALIISDLHSNIRALEAILAAESDSDVIYCAGDLVDVGPLPNEVIACVQANGIQCVSGNHDEVVLKAVKDESPTLENANADMKWYQHNAAVLNSNSISFIESLPTSMVFEMDGIVYGMTHMYEHYDVILGPYAYDKFIFDKFEGNENIERIIFGHTHRQAVCSVGDQREWLNPGSTAYRSYLEPGNDSKPAEYMTIVDGCFAYKSAAYDYDAAYQDVLACAPFVLKNEISRSGKRIKD